MKRLFAAIVAALLLTSCGVDSNPTEEYLSRVQEDAPHWTDEQALEVGEQACKALDRGATVEEFLNEAYEHGLNLGLVATVVANSAIYLCPEHAETVKQQSKELAEGLVRQT